MAIYNTSNLTEATNIVDLMVGINELSTSSSGFPVFGPVIYLSFLATFYFVFRLNSDMEGIQVGMFTLVIFTPVALMFTAMGLVSPFMVTFTIVPALLAIFVLYLVKNR